MATAVEAIRVIPPDDDDLYSGYNEFHPSLDTNSLVQDEGFQQAVETSYGRRPPTTTTGRLQVGYVGTSIGMRGQTSAAPPSRLGTGRQPGLARPMTAVRGAGYSSAGGRAQAGIFDPSTQAKAIVSPLQKENASPEDRIRLMEKAVIEIVEESCILASKQDYKRALEKAKEGHVKEKALSRQREQQATDMAANLDLMYCVQFNLAVQYTRNEMYNEALNTYQVIVKNKAFSNVGRLKVNMGNIYFQQGNYPRAIKFYRMALDQVPNTHKDMRIKIMKNIGLAFVRMTQIADAITSFEYIMAEKADFRSALHLIICQYALGDRDKTKRCFLKLLDVPLEHADEDKYTAPSDDPQANLYFEAIRNDALQKIEQRRKQEAEWSILTAAKLIAPVISSSFSEGYEWCVEQIKASPYAEIANDLEISKAVTYLRKREFAQAIETLKMFEKKDTKVASTAATNLSFLYFLQNDVAQADKYAEQAIMADRYNAGALVNKGNCCFANNQLERAVQYYRESLATEASCVEALYNLGVTYQKLGTLEEALECFYKLRAIITTYPQVVYQIGRTYELMKDMDQAMEWYQQLVTLMPTDPHLLAKIGEMCDLQGDKQMAFQYHSDSYRYFPSNIEIIEWLGAYYIETQLFEKAAKYFERAAVIQPNQVKWQLMVASCHRRSGSYQNALQTYKDIHRKFPENTECLRFLVRLTSDMGLADAEEYAVRLRKAEKAKELREQRSNSGSRSGSRRGSSRLSRESSANSNMSGSEQPVRNMKTQGTPSARSQGSNRLHIPVLEGDESYETTQKAIDASYEDPLGPLEQRPRTAARRRDVAADDEFDNEVLGEDLLPE
ncbi:intraflagellar transport protein 88 homolog [Ornithodoros turicata]|uniref:intraflagellar transport protein 88 homolog n=1 Tax=Ornithodoros turicata TaxID=34597 RepID=UPI003139E1B8